MWSPGNGPAEVESGSTIHVGYSFTYPTAHEAATLNIKDAALTLTMSCDGDYVFAKVTLSLSNQCRVLFLNNYTGF
jgi:hypothetical protein